MTALGRICALVSSRKCLSLLLTLLQAIDKRDLRTGTQQQQCLGWPETELLTGCPCHATMRSEEILVPWLASSSEQLRCLAAALCTIHVALSCRPSYEVDICVSIC